MMASLVESIRVRGKAAGPRAGMACLAVVLAAAAGLSCSVSGPGSAETSEELLVQLKEDRSQIDQASETMMKRIEMFNASRKPGEPTLQFSEIFMQDLNPEQRDTLDQLLQEEKDVSYRSLLQQIAGDRDTIRQLQEKVMRLEQTLPDQFVVAKRGDNHHELAMTYLTGEAGLDEGKARELLKQIDQTDELLAGNQVWFFHDAQKDTFRTYVTAGSAGQTPVMVRRARTRKLIKERDTARVEAASLKKEKAQVEEAFTTHQNSLFFHAASDQSLKERGVLSGFLRRLKDVQEVDYDQSVDLARETAISLDPHAYGMDRIRSVRLLPSIYQEGRDYAVEIERDQSAARLLILDPAVFRGKEVLLALRG
ncbi:MAG TPA: hypothetical protein VJV23_02465 [Candidatus Polarisedimenticolia bacterium]|nr:hypothetical protein [Candidatus Polarisedimenticolia bacterium]